MSIVKSIEQQIQALPEDEFIQIREWILGIDWKRWDCQIAQDVGAGKLDALMTKAIRDHEGSGPLV